MTIDLSKLQKNLYEWHNRNFPISDMVLESRDLTCIGEEIQAYRMSLGISEEAGEISHAILKFYQEIKGYNQEKMKAEVQDGIADIIVYAVNLASLLGIKIEDIINGNIEKVLQRDWKNDPQAGGEVLEPASNMLPSMNLVKKFPDQGSMYGKKVEVCFDFDISTAVDAICIRDDIEEPYFTIFVLEDLPGRFIMSTECQYRLKNNNNDDWENECQ